MSSAAAAPSDPPRPSPEARASAPARAFLWLALPAGLLFAALFPPFAVPDEPSHFFRAYAISRGDFLPSRQHGGLGSELPASVRALVPRVAAGLPHQHPIAPRALLDALAEAPGSSAGEFTDYRTATQVTAVPYLPAAAGIAVGRLLGASPLAQFYLARLATLLCATLITWAAVRRMPAYRWLLALIALTPMILSLRASVSADAITTALAFLATATLARLAWGDAASSGRAELWIAALASVALCLTKPVYFPLALAAVLIPANRWPGGRKATLLALQLGLVAVALAAAGWVAARADVTMREDAAVDRDAQVEYLLTEPARFAGVMVVDYVRHAARYGVQLFGKQLGWLDVSLPNALMLVYLAAVLWLWFADGEPALVVRTGERLTLGVLALAILALVSASQYATFTPLRAAAIEGIQGRYFLPAVPLALLVFHRRPLAGSSRRFRVRPLLVLGVAAGGLAIAAAAVVGRYWVLGGP